MVILQAIQDFGNWFWGIPILILIGGGGLFLTIYLGFPQIRHFGYAMSQTFGKMFAKKEEGKVRPISAAFAALACAVGASNIVGVPVAIALGGPGAVFWIWILAIFGMCTKYCEVAMGIKYRRKNDVGEWVGGPAYYLRGLGKKIGVVFGVGYAFFFMIELVPSLASQGVSAAEQFNVFGANQTVTGIIIAVLVGVILAGGFKRVSSVTDILVPVMACLYVLGALVIIFAHVGELPAIFGMIFQDAFTGRAAVGGFAGATVMAAIRWGADRKDEDGPQQRIAGVLQMHQPLHQCKYPQRHPHIHRHQPQHQQEHGAQQPDRRLFFFHLISGHCRPPGASPYSQIPESSAARSPGCPGISLAVGRCKPPQCARPHHCPDPICRR